MVLAFLVLRKRLEGVYVAKNSAHNADLTDMVG